MSWWPQKKQTQENFSYSDKVFVIFKVKKEDRL